MNAMTFFAADRNVVHNIRFEHSQGFHEQGSGGLSVYIEVTPDADHVIVPDRFVNTFDRWFDIRKWRRWNFIGVQKRASGVVSQDPASDESLRDEGMQAQG
jgi:hypothetical protein